MQFGLGAIVDQMASKAKRRFNLLMTEDREVSRHARDDEPDRKAEGARD